MYLSIWAMDVDRGSRLNKRVGGGIAISGDIRMDRMFRSEGPGQKVHNMILRLVTEWLGRRNWE